MTTLLTRTKKRGADGRYRAYRRRPDWVRPDPVRFSELETILVSHVLTHYLACLEARAPWAAQRCVDRLLPELGNIEAEKLLPTDLVAYKHKRAEEGGVSDKTIFNEIATLRAAFRLAWKHEAIDRLPRDWTIKKCDRPRQGCLSPEQFVRFADELPGDLREVALYLYFSGWRLGAVLQLEWRDVDLENGTALLRGELSKNGDPVLLPLAGVLGDVIDRRREKTEWSDPECPFVFHREGKPIRDLYCAWRSAARRAGVDWLRPHDLRRSLATLHAEAGVPAVVTMAMAGWKTDSMYRRYVIGSKRATERGIETAEAFFRRALGSEDEEKTP